MENLAGDKYCDTKIRRELERARIPVKEVTRAHTEVPYSLIGVLGDFQFHRAWYYWVVEGPVGLEVAEKMYEDPVGHTDIRVGGDAGCPPPAKWAEDRGGIKYVMVYHIDTEVGLRVFADTVKAHGLVET